MLKSELIPASEKGSRRLLIMLHGLGDSIEGYRWVPEGLDLPWLNAIAAQFHLRVIASQELDVAIR